MSFKINCPHCTRTLYVTEPAFGKTVPCPGCNQPVRVPYPPQPLRQASPLGAQAWSGAAHDGETPRDTVPSSPAGMPPVPASDEPIEVLNGSDEAPARAGALANAVQGLNLTDMFLGNEEKSVFSLLPGEQRLAELTIHHQYFFVVKSGVTRVTLTSQRFLYTATRVFSPVYWLLLVLFPPLIFYDGACQGLAAITEM